MEKTNILSDSNRIGLKSLNNHCFDMKQIFVQLQNSSDDAEREKKICQNIQYNQFARLLTNVKISRVV